LAELLTQLFDSNGLRIWVYLNLGPRLAIELPGEASSLADLAFRVVLAIGQHDLAVRDTFVALISERPAQEDRIWDVARLWGVQRHPVGV
jgi:hypothetical protein